MRPLVDEVAADRRQLDRVGDDDWPAWWRASGQRELRCILMTAWDPVGVGDAPEAWDEYDNYAPGIAHRLRDATDRDEVVENVAEYVNHVEQDFMGVLTDERRRRNGYLAECLAAWHEWSFEHRGRPPHEWIDDD